LPFSLCSNIWLPAACGKGKWAITVAGTSVGFAEFPSLAPASVAANSTDDNREQARERFLRQFPINHFTISDTKPSERFLSEVTIPPALSASLLRRDPHATGGVQR
jgi:hypothetical protein